MSTTADYISKLESYTTGKNPMVMQSQTPRVLAQLVAGVSEQKLRQRPQADKWSVNEILAHLAEDEVVTSWRYRQMIENSGCDLAAFDQDTWARLGHYASWQTLDALEMFRLLREANLRLLSRLTDAEWERYGVHAERGKISLRDLARHMAGHDMNHIAQVRAILSIG